MPGAAMLNRKWSIGDSCGGDFHEGATDPTVFGFAKKEALFGGAIVVGLAEGTAAVCDESGVFKSALCEAVEMSAESGPQVMLFKHLQHAFGILGAHLNRFAE